MYKKFDQLVKARGITAYRVAKDLELAPTVFSDWKSGKSKPKVDKLKKSQVEPALALIRETLELDEEDVLVPFSAEKGTGKEELLGLLNAACEE